MKNRVWLFSLVCVLSSCSSTSSKTELFEGENLITPFSKELSGWDLYKKDEGNFHSRIWQKPGKGFADSFAVSLTYYDKSGTKHKRQVVDRPGEENCHKFESTTLQFPNESTFPVECWETLCENGDDFKAKILHLMFQGNDSFYYIQKTWKQEFSDQDVNEWKAKFETMFVCDTRTNTSPCPDLKKVVDV